MVGVCGKLLQAAPLIGNGNQHLFRSGVIQIMLIKKIFLENYFRDLWRVEQGTFVVGYSGNLAKFHPIETFVQGIEILRDDKDIKFIFVGRVPKKGGLSLIVKKII